ncbi:mediator of RNA polymerase II transcription subunit 4 isoform X1 [Xenopus laevis]|uniref:Mediator of RNA polymerase II transcription subunit 4 n=1 Tax=Xenopus laevis TaxID=8355 RepID=A0A8J1MDI0_XENLA|nr:mediator of RNA polymerase II transcription subunit 4 isoform X1 [Xenopus laevis]
MAVPEKSTKERLESLLDDLEVLSREVIETLALSRSQKLSQPGEENQVFLHSKMWPSSTNGEGLKTPFLLNQLDCNNPSSILWTLNILLWILELLIQKDGEFQELMKVAFSQGKTHQEMQVLEKEVEKRDSDIQQLQKQLKEAEHILATAVYQAKEKLKSIDKARKGVISSEELIKYAHRISASNAVCAPLTWVPGDPRRPYPTDLEMRSGLLGQMSNLPTNGVNGHLPGDALAAGRLPDVLAPQYPWQSSDMSMNMLPPNHSNEFLMESLGPNKENEEDVEVMSTDSSSSSSDSD